MDAVLTAMVEDKIGPGEQSRLLIQIAREYLQYDYCFALRSPAIALYWALSALNPEDGQGVVLSALAPRYCGQVLRELRLTPVYADAAPGSAVISPETINAAIDRKPEGVVVRCILASHTLGYVPDMPAIAQLGLPVIEDCSQSYGTMIGAARAGSFGVFTILGLEEHDMLTSGGGALLYAVNRRDAAVLRNQEPPLPEYSLPDLNAAMAVVQFKEYNRNSEKRREIAQAYTQSALRTRHKRFVQPEIADPGALGSESGAADSVLAAQSDAASEGVNGASQNAVRENSGEQNTVEYNNYAFPLILETGMKDVKAYAKRKDIAVESAFEDTLVGSIPPELCPEAYSLSLRTALFPLYPRLGAAEIGKVAKLIMTLP
ncbi:aminotransferase [Spirochaetia bacterium]|nr:aminotransferase [Spirochaetia bacterium]